MLNTSAAIVAYYDGIRETMALSHPSPSAGRLGLQMLQVTEYRIKNGILHIDDMISPPYMQVPELKYLLLLYEAYRDKLRPAAEILAELAKFSAEYLNLMVTRFGFPRDYVSDTGLEQYISMSPNQLRAESPAQGAKP